MLHRDYPDQVCSIARALEVVGERWTLLIVRDAALGLSRFDEFQRSLRVASNVLSSRLRLLCDEGVMERVPDEQHPGRQRYVLTEKGAGLRPALIMLMKWGDQHYAHEHGPPRLTVHRDCGGDVSARLVCERCGQNVDFADIELHAGAPLVGC